jgi:hypothetical protein
MKIRRHRPLPPDFKRDQFSKELIAATKRSS